MLIRIDSAKSHENDKGLTEYVLIELQGELQSTKTAKLDGNVVGKMSSQNNSLSFVIGGHKLRGKVVDLPAPRLVVEKCSSTVGQAKLVVRGIIRKRLCFFARPQPLLLDQVQSEAGFYAKRIKLA